MIVGEVLRLLSTEGWYLVATRGSHRQFKARSKPGRVTVVGKPSDDLAPGTLDTPSQLRTPRQITLRTGCVATGATVEEAVRSIREAVELHLEGMREDGIPMP